MSSNKYENQILDAIQTIVDSAVSRASYDKTIKAVISKCVDEVEGKYVVKYQNSSFYAYGKNGDPIYSNGTYVYVLVPGNDMAQKKTIVGTVDDLGKDYIDIIESDAGYEVIGNNIVEDNSSEFGLCSYKIAQQIILYDKNNTSDSNLININVISAEEYIKNSQYLICGADFRTILKDEQKLKGNYGIGFDLNFIDAGTDNVITKTYIIDINNMTGDPYNFIQSSNQKVVFEIDGETFNSIDKIYIFESNFPNEEEGKENDIFITNISLEGAVALTQEELSQYSLSFVTPQGIYFDDNDLESATRELQTMVRVQGKKINSSSNLLQYYWFKENNSINSSSPEYNRYGGLGWECLNSYNTIEEDFLREWIPGDWNFIIKKSDNNAAENTYKCVVLYNNSITISKEITIKNKSIDKYISIFTDDGRSSYNYESGVTPLLTCYVNGESHTESNWTYQWSMLDANGQYNTLGTSSEDIIINNNTLLIKNLGIITNFIVFKCFVYDNGVYIGKNSITIRNSKNNDLNLYNLTLINNNQVFKYDGDGISPTSRSKENPQTIYPLSFILYDASGKEIDINKIKKENISWTVPTEDTLITVSGTPDIEDLENHTKTYIGLTELYFDISVLYSMYKTNNSIQLTVTYLDYTISEKINIVCIKEGENGTNGTNFICRIVPYEETDETKNYYPTCFVDWSSLTLDYNFNVYNYTIPFKVQFWHDGELIYDSNTSGVTTEGENITLNWKMKHNKYQADSGLSLDNYIDYSDFSIWPTTGAFSRNTETKDNTTRCENPGNIIQCELIYKNKKYYTSFPLISSWASWGSGTRDIPYKILLKRNTGFRSVLYDNSGGNPQYDNRNPFELTVLEKNDTIYTDISNDDSLTYRWFIRGAVYNTETSDRKIISKAVFNLEDFNIGYTRKSNQYKYKPINTYSGYCVTNGILCEVRKNGNYIGSIHIPIDFYLNQYSNSQINDWDGNSILLAEDDSSFGGMILAPQVGAGTKDENNRFTGVFMGAVQHDGLDPEHGLYGYNKGIQTIALNAKDGSAAFGKNGGGQIIIQPDENTAILKSGNYNPDRRTGMQIDLSTPEIRYGNGKFIVDSNGNLTATSASITGEIIAENGQFGTSVYPIRIKPNATPVDNSAIYTGDKDSLNANANGFYIGTDGIALGQYTDSDGNPFQVTPDGALRAMNATIKGNITANSLTLGTNVKVPVEKIDGLDSAIQTEIDDLDILYQGDIAHTRSTSSDGHLITDTITFKDADGTSQSYTTYTSTSDGYVYTNVGLGTPNTSHSANYVKISKNGLLEADNAIIYGTIHAGAGQIAGWSIGTNALTKGKVGLSSNNSADTNIAIWAGNTTATSAPFRVDFNGKVIASSGTIGGWTLGTNRLSSGSGTGYVALDSGTSNTYAIWAGNATDSSAPFRVTRAGKLYATGVDISGAIAATSGTFGNGTKKITIRTVGTTDSAIYSGDKSSFTANKEGFYIGTNGISLGKVSKIDVSTAESWSMFQVKPDGSLYAASAEIEGTLTAGANSKIGPWTVATDAIYNNKDSSTSTSNGIYIGKDVIALGAADSNGDSPFRVNSSGQLRATTGNIGGWTIGANDLTNTTSTYKVGMYNGNNQYGDFLVVHNLADGTAPFFVHTDGYMYANNAHISGEITATSGTIGGWGIDSVHLYKGTGKYWFEIRTDRASTDPALLVWHENNGYQWYVRPDGYMYAKNAYVQGEINATSGTFRGTIYASAGEFIGTVKANSGNIGAWEIKNNCLHGESNGYWIDLYPWGFTDSQGNTKYWSSL